MDSIDNIASEARLFKEIRTILAQKGVVFNGAKRIPTSNHIVYANDTLYAKIVDNTSRTKRALRLQMLNYAHEPIEVYELPNNSQLLLIVPSHGTAIDTMSCPPEVGAQWADEIAHTHATALPTDYGEHFCDWQDMFTNIPSLVQKISHTDIREFASSNFQRLYSQEPRIDTPVVVHGDPNLRNFTIDTTGSLWLVDWDHAAVGPKEWDYANFAMACLLVNRPDIWAACKTTAPPLVRSLLEWSFQISLLRTLIHLDNHREFEGTYGFEVRKNLVTNYLESSDII